MSLEVALCCPTYADVRNLDDVAHIVLPQAFAIFIPALIGRLASGVLLQANKIGTDFENILPESFQKATDGWEKSVNSLFDTLCLDDSFFVTLIGTSVFQHVLNGTTFILLHKGKLASGTDLKNYMTKGTSGKAGGGVEQFIRTLGMRFGFCLAWNWCSSQPVDKSAADIALEQLGPAPSAAGAAAK